MSKATASRPQEQASESSARQLPLYFIVAFGISWVIWLPLLGLSQKWFAARAPFVLYYVGTAGPALAALILVALADGKTGVASLLGRLFKWRVAIRWYLIVVLLPIVVRAAALGGVYVFGYVGRGFSLRPWIDLLSLFALMLLLVPLEEIGWRGYALPRMQTFFGGFWASMILGVMWSLWHLPLIWVSGSYQESDSPVEYIFVFTLTILPISVLFTWVFNNTGGSLLLVCLFHAVINVTEAALIIHQDEGRLLLMAAFVIYSALAVLVTVRSNYRTNTIQTLRSG